MFRAVETELKKMLDIPVFHDDQHGTAIISGAGSLNALEITGKKIEDYQNSGMRSRCCCHFLFKVICYPGLKKET